MRHFAPPALPSPGGGASEKSMPRPADQAGRGLVAAASAATRLERLDASEQSVIVVDLAGRLTWMNAESLRSVEICGCSSLLGRDWLEFWPAGERHVVAAALESARDGIPARFAAVSHTLAGDEAHWDVNITPDGPRIAGEPTFTVYMQDITERRLALARLNWAATHDGLTGLANRTLFYNSLDRMIESAKRTGERFALVAFDLDRFKQINERFGHNGGDVLLSAFAKRLAEITPAGGLAARFGGDEFALLANVVTDPTETIAYVESVLKYLRRPYVYGGRSIECTASAGIAIYPLAGDGPDALFTNADTALLAGKAEEPGRAVMFSGAMRQDLQRKVSALQVAATAIQADWIEPHYQPQMDLATGRLSGFEALLRWRQPNGPWQSPATISAAFADKVLATQITDIMLRKVIRDLNRWQRGGLAVPVAVNVSGADLQAEDFAGRLLGRLGEGGIALSLIEVEVTEGVFLGDGAAHVARVLRTLSDAGVRIALDDFGTGYASLSHLKHFPVNVIKIDRSFVSNVTTSHEDRTIVRTMIDLGKSMSIRVVAEGIEDGSQLSFLKQTGCDVGQGFWFGKAVPATEIEQRFSPMSLAFKSVLP